MVTTTQLNTNLNNEIAARKAADLVLQNTIDALTIRVAALETPITVPAGTIVTPADDIKALLAQGIRKFVMRAGTYHFSFSSVETTFKDVSFLPYPGEIPVIDGTGLDPHFVYLGPTSGSWTLGIALRNFFPTGSGVIGIGDGCNLTTVKGFSLVGIGAPAANQDHGVYFHGTGTGTLTEPNITNFPGSALQSYRGTPVVNVTGGVLHGLYVGVFCYSGTINLTNVDVRGAGTEDVDWQTPSTFNQSNCTGGGINNTVRLNGPHV